MTVAELIAELAKMPQHATALVKHDLGWRHVEVCRGSGTEYGLPQPFVCIVPGRERP